MFSFKGYNRKKFEEAGILTSHIRTQTLAIGSVHQVKPALLLLLLRMCPCEADINMNKLIFFFLWSFSLPLFFFLSVLFFLPPPILFVSTPCHWTVKTRDVAAAHQHAVDFDSCVPVLPPSLSLSDAISDYIVITNALGVCSQPSLCRTRAKLFRGHCFQVWIYMGVKCFLRLCGTDLIFLLS